MSELTDYPSQEHFELMRDSHTDLIDRVAGLADMLARVDRLIGNMGLMLNVSQPACDGKLGIRWWSDGKKRRPLFVEWKQQKRGLQRFYPVRIEGRVTKRQKRHSGFAVNAQPTEELLNFSVEMMRIRTVLINGLYSISRIETEITKHNKRTIENQENMLQDIGRRIRENNDAWEEQKKMGLLDELREQNKR